MIMLFEGRVDDDAAASRGSGWLVARVGLAALPSIWRWRRTPSLNLERLVTRNKNPFKFSLICKWRVPHEATII